MAIGATCILSVGTFKYMMGQINKSTITPADFKSNIYKTDNSFDDYYGGESIKEKFKEVIDFLH
jgi:ATP-dependent Zn protease